MNSKLMGHFALQCLLRALLCCYYMASFVRGQDEPNRALWLATRAGKMELSYPLGTTRRVPRKKFPTDQAFSVKIAGYCMASLFFCEFMDLDSVSIHKHGKKNLANIQPPWPHTWSITHILERTFQLVKLVFEWLWLRSLFWCVYSSLFSVEWGVLDGYVSRPV